MWSPLALSVLEGRAGSLVALFSRQQDSRSAASKQTIMSYLVVRMESSLDDQVAAVAIGDQQW